MERSENLRRNEYAPNCPEEEFIVPLLKHEIEYRINKIFKQKPIKNVLDIGCGSQPFRHLMESYGAKYWGLDINEKQHVDFVAEIDKELNTDVINSGPYDFILCTEVLEHVSNWDDTFSNFYKLLNDGGMILITTPHFYPLHEVPYDFWRPTIYSFSHFANKHNLKIVELTPVGTFWDILGTLLANTPQFSIKENKLSLKNKVIYRLLNRGSKYMFKVLKSRYLHNNINATCYMYQSNIIVLSK
jgi:2-polyprenyl-3-methyl-5-hydroxy-6-metoxy-1,4-benzoquinol methylase